MKKHLLTLICLMFVSTASAQLNITTNTTWSGTVYMTQNVVIHAGATLTIQQGTEILVGFVDQNLDGKGEVELIVQGKIMSLGNPCSQVSFEPLQATPNKNWWVGVTVTSIDTSLFQCTAISNASNALEITGRCETNGLYTSNCGLSAVYANGCSFAKLQAVHSNNDSTGIRMLDASGVLADWCSIDNCASNAFQIIQSQATITNSIGSNISVCGVYTEDSDVIIHNVSLDASMGLAGLMTSNGTINVERSSFQGKAMGLLITGGGTIVGDSLHLIGTNPVVISDFVTTLNRFAEFALYRFHESSAVPTIKINNSNLNRLGNFNEAVPVVFPVYGLSPAWYSSGDTRLFGWDAYPQCQDALGLSTPGHQSYETPIRAPFGFIAAFTGETCGNSGQYTFNRTRLIGDHERLDGSFFSWSENCISDNLNYLVTIPNEEIFNLVRYRLFFGCCYYNPYNGSNESCLACPSPNAASQCEGRFSNIRTQISLNPAFSLSSTYRNGNYGFDFQLNYWGELSNVASRIRQINTASNINYNGFSPVTINNVGAQLEDNGFTVSNFPMYVLNRASDVVCSGGSANNPLSGPINLSSVTYDWVFNGSSYGETSASIQPPAVGSYAVNISNGLGCSETSAPLDLIAEPFIASAAIATPNGLNACVGQNVLLDGSAYSNYSLEWFKDGDPVGTGSTLLATQEGTYSLQVSTANGNCSITSPTVNVVFSQYPSGSIASVGIPQLCTGETLLLRVSSQSTNVTGYNWLLNGSAIGITNDSAYVSQSGVYSVQFTTGNNCTAVSTNQITVAVTTPVATITANGSTSLCPSGSVTLSANTGSSYQWSNGASSQSIIVTQGGSYNVTVTDANGCSATSLSTLVTVAPSPTATIIANGPTTFCAGGNVTLSANSGSAYLWSNGATTQNITVAQGAFYNVTVTNASGCSATSSNINVVVSSAPSAIITPSGPTTFCTGGNVILSANSGSSYLWSNGATTQNITVAQGAFYNVTVTNASGCSATSNNINVVVSSAPSAIITPSGPTTFCTGGNVILYANSGSAYLWSNGATTQNITVASGASYNVTVTNASGCSATSSDITVVVSVAPAAIITPSGATTFCTGDNVTLSANSGSAYLWSNGANSQSITVTQGASYSVSITYANGCTSNSNVSMVTVNNNPNVTLSGLAAQYSINSTPVALTGIPSGGVYDGPGMNANIFNPALAGLGTYCITYEFTDSNGCVDMDSLCTTVDIATGFDIGVDNSGSGVEIYPNPANGLYNLLLEQLEGIVTAKVYDAQGREVWANALVANGARSQHSIDLSTHAKGIYTLQLQTNQGTITRKLVKN